MTFYLRKKKTKNKTICTLEKEKRKVLFVCFTTQSANKLKQNFKINVWLKRAQRGRGGGGRGEERGAEREEEGKQNKNKNEKMKKRRKKSRRSKKVQRHFQRTRSL